MNEKPNNSLSLPDHPVLSEIQRRANGDSPQLKLALAVEGGGMRGVVTGAMVCALQSSGLKAELFDGIFGSSGGALNSAYYIADQAPLGEAIYWENNRFVDLRRLGRGRVLDLNIMIDEIAENESPLNFEKVVDAKKLHPLGTEVETATRRVFEPAENKDELRAQLKATATMPFVGGSPVKIGNNHYYDAALSEAVPLEAALEKGYDAILVLCSRSLEDGVAKMNLTQRAIGALILRDLNRQNPELVTLIRQRRDQNLRMLETLKRMKSEPGQEPPFAIAVEPGKGLSKVSNFEKAPAKLITAAKLGYSSVKNLFGLPSSGEFRTVGLFEEI